MPGLSIGLVFAWHLSATAEAIATRHACIEPGHLSVGLLSLEKLLRPGVQSHLRMSPQGLQTLASEWEKLSTLFAEFGINATRLRRAMRQRLGQGTATDTTARVVHRSAASQALFGRAESLVRRADTVTSFHLFVALLEEPDGLMGQLLEAQGVDAAALHATVLTLLSPGMQVAPGRTPLLQKYGRDLAHLARMGRITACVGRRDEMLRVIRILSRDTKGNPLLLGEPGVGKTALVEGLAWRVAQRKSLHGKRIIQLRVTDLVAGMRTASEGEERLHGLLREVTQTPDVILFLDDLHTVLDAAERIEGIDAAHILKGALVRGEVRCIGATTEAAYEQYIASDLSLERSFQPLVVAEPSLEAAQEILSRGYQQRFAQKHGVTIEPAAIHATVALSARHLPTRRLPEKAIDLLDEACARVAISTLSASTTAYIAPSNAVVTAEVVATILAEWSGIPVAQLTAEAAV